MLCDQCKKNEATVHIKEFHNGVCQTHHLCAECAAKQEHQGALGALGFNLAEVLFNVGKFTEELKKKSQSASQAAPADPPAPPSPICPVCHWDAEKIRENNGKMGCPECYRTFDSILAEAFQCVQKGNVHVGKRPGGTVQAGPEALKAELKRLQKELAILISREEYESAAICRDRINLLKNEIAKVTR